MFKLKILFLFFLLIKYNFVLSQQISNYEINKISINFYKAYIDSNIKTADIKFEYKYYSYQSYPCLIIIKYFDNNWLLISNDKKSFPILAFSNQKSYTENIPENVLFWFNEYSADVFNNLMDDSLKGNLSDTIWNYFINGNIKTIKSGGVNPFVLTKWGQSSSNDGNDSYAYNFYTPPKNDNEQCLHTLVGCPAVAAGQIIRYLKYPYCSIFNYNNMTYELNTSDINYLLHKKEIANLLRNIGDKMNYNDEYYGCSASGTSEQIIYNALINDFLLIMLN